MPQHPAPMDRDAAPGTRIGVRLGRWLAAGMPYIGGLAAVGGLLTVLAYAVGGAGIALTAPTLLNDGSWAQSDTWAALMLKTGASAMALLPPLIGGYVAHGMAGRRAMVPGAVGGVVAMSFQGGFLGGLVAGLVAGATARGVQRLAERTPRARGVVATAAVPLLSTVVTTGVVFVAVGPRVASLVVWLNNQLTPLTWDNALLCGVLLGLMVCSDLSGALSRAAIAFAATGTQTAPNPLNFTIMATVVAAAMVPPIALSLATLVRRSLFTPAERTYGKAAWLLGAAFVPEGAIPFAAADPLRVVPASMAGGAVTGALAMTFGTTLPVSDGGVFAADQLGKPTLFLLAVAAGVLVTTAAVLLLKGFLGRPAEEPAAAAPAPGGMRGTAAVAA